MKQIWRAVNVFAVGLFCVSSALAQPSASKALLQQMEQASQSLNYELAYINVSHLGIESLRYRHAIINNKPYAQLLQMDGPQREIVQRGHDISYFEAGMTPFTLSGNHIVDALPSIIYADFQHIAENYDFVAVGRTRIADQLCEVVRVVARDGTRYSYIVWLDMETSLPLRVDLLDSDGETLEQFRVISFAVDNGVRNLMQTLEKTVLPPSLSVPQNEKVAFHWKPAWLPAGMREVSQSRRKIPLLNKAVESRFYSDGLFSFSINLSPVDKSSATQLLRTGRRTVRMQIRNNMEITVVGELPPSTAKRIADSINLGLQP